MFSIQFPALVKECFVIHASGHCSLSPLTFPTVMKIRCSLGYNSVGQFTFRAALFTGVAKAGSVFMGEILSIFYLSSILLAPTPK